MTAWELPRRLLQEKAKLTAFFFFFFNVLCSSRVDLHGRSVVKNPPTNVGAAGNAVSIPVLGRSLGGGNGNPVQYSYWDIPIVHEITESDTSE